MIGQMEGGAETFPMFVQAMLGSGIRQPSSPEPKSADPVPTCRPQCGKIRLKPESTHLLFHFTLQAS